MSPLRIAVFMVVVFVVLGGFVLHLYRRATGAFALPVWARRLMLALLGSGLGAAIVARFSGDGPLGRTLGEFGGGTTMAVLITGILLWPYELGRLVAWVVARVTRRADRAPDEVAQPARRQFIEQVAVGSAGAVGFGAAGYGALFGRHDYALESVPVHLPTLPRALDGFTIAQLSDLHVGLYVGEREFRSGLELVRKARPDVIVLTGDLVDHDPRYAGDLARFVRALRDLAPRGVFAIPGNHDYYAGASEVLHALGEAGAEVLLNRHVQLGDAGGRFVLAGVDDVVAPMHGGRGPDLAKAFQGAPDDVARVLLSHNPSFYPEAHRHADLVLSGHTHGGQITLFVNPAELVLSHGYVRGLYRRDAGQLYVNRGFGTAGPPVRVGSPPEVTRLILTASA